MNLKFLLVLFMAFGIVGAQEIPITPLPNAYESKQTEFTLGKHTFIDVKHAPESQAASYLKSEILHKTGISVSSNVADDSQIVFALVQDSDLLKKGAYKLKMDKKEIQIQAKDETGLFYGANSLLQIISAQELQNDRVRVPNFDVTDEPLYKWRGFMLDESRQFFGEKVVKNILDEMAHLKLNKFHWHLTDEPGWRLEIKKYPLLSLIGGIGNYHDDLAPAQFYTQEEIREIVAYAKERHIEVIPEIDMPGHATAANRAYPQYSGGGTEEYPEFTFNPGKEETYTYLTDILREVSVLFPSKMIHLGGDEVSFGIEAWKEKEEIKNLMTEHNFSELKEVEDYFLTRMADSALTVFDEIIGWDEITDTEIPVDETTVFWWRHDKPDQLKKALEKGHKTVLMPRIPLYLDFVQDSTHQQGRRWGEDFSSLKPLYDFSIDDYLDEGFAKEHNTRIQGIQANLWTEQIRTKKRLEYMIFPRLTALAEAAWTNEEAKDYQDYLLRLKDILKRYDKQSLNYFNPLAKDKTPEVVD